MLKITQHASAEPEINVDSWPLSRSLLGAQQCAKLVLDVPHPFILSVSVCRVPGSVLGAGDPAGTRSPRHCREPGLEPRKFQSCAKASQQVCKVG